MPESFGTYELLQKIAQGGMAEIFLATRTSDLGGFEKQVAIKRIFRHLTGREETVNMFFDEARIAATLNHPNIVQVFDLGEVEGYFYIAMEFVHGTDLRRVCKRGLDRDNYLPVELAAHIVAETAAGLHYAHTRTDEEGKPRNIVHRDISPQNVLLSMEGHVKICDFGIAKAENRLARTRTGQFKGKLSYMSPEQFNGDEVDARSDIFNLGIVLYEITLARRLFDAKTDFERMRQIANAHVTPPSEVDPDYPPELERIILKALQHDPDDRYQTAEEMQLEIEDWLHERDAKVGAVQVANYMEQLFPELVGGIPEDMAQVEFPSTGRGSVVEEASQPESSGDDEEELSPGQRTEKLRPEQLTGGGGSEDDAPTVEAGAAAQDLREEEREQSESKGEEDEERSEASSGTYGTVTVDPSKQSASPSDDEEEVDPTKKISVDRGDIARADDPSDLGVDSSSGDEQEGADPAAPTKRTPRGVVGPEAPTEPRERGPILGEGSDEEPSAAQGRTEQVEIPAKNRRTEPREQPPADQSSSRPGSGGGAAADEGEGPPGGGGPPRGGRRGSQPPSSVGPEASGPPARSGGPGSGGRGGPPAPPGGPGGSPEGAAFSTGDTEPDNPPNPDHFEFDEGDGSGGLEPNSALGRTWKNLVGALTDSDDSLTDDRGRLIALGILVAGVIGGIVYIYLALVHSPDLSEMKNKMKRRKEIAAKAADAAGADQRPNVPTVSVSLETKPKGAFVVVNGLPAAEKTPAKVTLVEGEKNEVYFYKSGRVPRRVIIEADGSKLPTFELEEVGAAGVGPLRITSEPKGAVAFVDGKRVGKTPVTAEEIPRSGRHFLQMKKKGRHPVFALFEMRKKSETAISARLSISKGPEDDDYCEVVYDIVPQGSMVQVNGRVQGTSVTAVRHTCGEYLKVQSWRSNYEDGTYYLFLEQPGKYLLRSELEKIVRAKGTVTVDAPPDLRVFIGSNSYGKGSVGGVELPEGEYRAVFQPAGSNTRYEKTLKVVPGTTTKYRIRIQGGSATLERVTN